MLAYATNVPRQFRTKQCETIMPDGTVKTRRR